MGDIMSRSDLKTMVPQPKSYKRGPFTVEAAGYKKVEGETIPRVHPGSKNGLKTTPEDDIFTVWDLVKKSGQKFGNAKALGTRKLIKIHRETKKIKKKVDGNVVEQDKEWQYFELGSYEYISFTEYEKLARKVGSGYRALGLTAGDRIQIFAATSAKWLAISHGACSQSMPIVTAYDTLGEEGLKHSMQQAGSKAIFLDGTLLKKLIKPLAELKEVKHVIYNKEAPEFNEADVQKLKDAHSQVHIIEFDDFVKLGEKNMVDPVAPSREDLCCIMYTSGSTGTPKGVLLKHKNVIASIAGVNAVVGPYIGPGDGLLTYLPLAHILEFVFENACLNWGGTMGYGHPKTISDANVRNCSGDIREFKPTILVGVPAVWETVKKGILTKVSKSSPIVKSMFWGAMTAKSMMMHNSGLPGTALGTSLVDSVVFSKIKDATGGRLRICMCGGGPIAKDTQRFISMAIAPMVIGYGLTETSAMGALMDPLSWNDTSLGGMPGSVEVKLVDYKDAGYDTASNPPQGEIWIRGDAVSSGYLSLDKETKESFTDDGWFMTGDVGEFDRDGNLKIIDRKKNLVKTLNGEYIALEKLESIYRATNVVGNICVYASPDKTKPIAIVVPNEGVLKGIASQNGVSGSTLEELVQDEKLNAIVLRDMQAQGKKGGLSGIEIIDGVVLADEEWTPQNQLVTSAQKLNRKGILNKYKTEVDKAYA
ncbi:acetyl-CoA synthetase-like protein [Myriangium duriaei CBS 260.36]|uniref:Acetyl-CoA synthetase-like protein n=1 Tax=Myriangium duriaei CBS 260.36 TaxID=1168546 RepID=A0A9P4MF68_9PEZI|nr:acetyl-CoA synthetase-like protein [Myriangium duriaei CBS 260.36]